jgi:hypothetical protein
MLTNCYLTCNGARRCNTTLRAIIPLPDLNAPPTSAAHLNAYQEFPAGSTVMALYPDTSCFYRAEVIASPRDFQPSGRASIRYISFIDPLNDFKTRSLHLRNTYRLTSSNSKMTMIKSTLLQRSGSLNGLDHDDAAQSISLYIYHSLFYWKSITSVSDHSTCNQSVFLWQCWKSCRICSGRFRNLPQRPTLQPRHSFGPSRRFPAGGHVMQHRYIKGD